MNQTPIYRVSEEIKSLKKGGDIVKMSKPGFLVILIFTAAAFLSFYAEPAQSADPLAPRVSADKLAEAKGLKNAVASNAKTVADAKGIYAGKGACLSCHGEAGKGDGAAGASFNPKPRNFADINWQKARTDGEIFWAITHGTDFGMLAYENMLSKEERWTLVNYIREFGKPIEANNKK